MALRRVGVLGMGLMGNGIAQITAAVANLPVVAYDVSPDAAAKGRAAISKSLRALAAKQVAKGALDAAGAEAYLARAEGNLTTATDLGALRACDIVIEAAPESWELKRKLYSGLAAHLAPAAVLASNTSGLLIEDLAREFGHPERVVGLHFFNPVPLMQLVEIVSTPRTAPAVTEAVTALVRAQGKTPVQCKDSPGFVVNRLLVPFLAQAIRLHSEGVASTADIDAAMRLGCGHPMGPLHLADYVGLDTTLFILKNWTAKYPGEPAFLCVAQAGGWRARARAPPPQHLYLPPSPTHPPPRFRLLLFAAFRRRWWTWWPRGTWGARAAGAFTRGLGTRWARPARRLRAATWRDSPLPAARGSTQLYFYPSFSPCRTPLGHWPTLPPVPPCPAQEAQPLTGHWLCQWPRSAPEKTSLFFLLCPTPRLAPQKNGRD